MPIAIEAMHTTVLAAFAFGSLLPAFSSALTAQRIGVFLVSPGKKGLFQIAEYAHVLQLRMSHPAGSLQASLDELSAFVRLVAAPSNRPPAIPRHQRCAGLLQVRAKPSQI